MARHTTVNSSLSRHLFGAERLTRPLAVTRVQKYSSYAFTIFATLHLANTSVIPLITQSVPEASTYLLLTRPFYQSALLEPLLIGLPLITHIGSGLALRQYRYSQNVRRYGSEPRHEKKNVSYPKISGTSALGLALTPLVFGHIFLNRSLPLAKLGDSSTVGLEYVAHGFALHPAIGFFGYTILVSIASWHIVWGWAKFLRLTPSYVTEGGLSGQHKRKKAWYLVNAAGAGVAGLWLAGALGVVGRGGLAGGWLGAEYDDLYRSIPIVGPWLM